MKYTLKNPITVPACGDKPEHEVTELILADRMKVKHLKNVPNDAFSGEGVNPVKFVPAIVAMSGLPESVIDELEFTDLAALMTEIVAPFLAGME